MEPVVLLGVKFKKMGLLRKVCEAAHTNDLHLTHWNCHYKASHPNGSKPLLPVSKASSLTDLDFSPVLCGTKVHSVSGKGDTALRLLETASARPAFGQLSKPFQNELTYPIFSPRQVALHRDGASRSWERSLHDTSHEWVNQGWRHLSSLLHFIQNLQTRCYVRRDPVQKQEKNPIKRNAKFGAEIWKYHQQILRQISSCNPYKFMKGTILGVTLHPQEKLLKASNWFLEEGRLFTSLR